MRQDPQELLSVYRLEISQWFQTHAPSLGELYDGSVHMLYAEVFPGRTRFISHAVREIRNRLPNVIIGTTIKRSNFDLGNRLNDLVKSLSKMGYSFDKANPRVNVGEEKTSVDTVLISRAVLERIESFVQDYKNTKPSGPEIALRLFAGRSSCNPQEIDSLRPQALQWYEVTEWFMHKTHDGGKTDKDVDLKEFREKFELFEVTLGALLRGFFKTKEALDEILEQTNS